MNELRDFAALRPNDEPLDAATSARIWDEIVGTDRIGATADSRRVHRKDGHDHGDSAAGRSGTVRDRRARRIWAWAGAAAVVVIGLVGLIVAVGGRVADERQPSVPATDPAAEEEAPAPRDPVTTTATPEDDEALEPIDPGATPTPVPSDAAGVGQVAFTPLGLETPPPGFELVDVELLEGPGGYGIARYGSAAHATELWLVLRHASDGFVNVRELDRATWEVDGRTVYSDGELDGCLTDFCSIGVQWDANTSLSLQWVEPAGRGLVAGSDQASLRVLLPLIVEAPELWTDGPRSPGESTETGSRPAVLLVPSGGQSLDHVGSLFAGPSSSQHAVILAPDGSMLVVRTMYDPSPSPEAAIDERTIRTFGSVEVTVDASGQLPLFTWRGDCWTVTVVDGGGIDTGDRDPWREPINELFGSASSDSTWVTFAPPAGWELLALGGREVIHDVHVSLPATAGDSAPALNLIQSVGSGAALSNGMAARDLRRVPFLDGEAWAGRASSDPEVTTVMWHRDGSSYLAQSEGLGVDEVEDAVASMESITVAEWVARFGEPEVPADDPVASSCPLPLLAVRTG